MVPWFWCGGGGRERGHDVVGAEGQSEGKCEYDVAGISSSYARPASRFTFSQRRRHCLGRVAETFMVLASWILYVRYSAFYSASWTVLYLCTLCKPLLWCTKLLSMGGNLSNIPRQNESLIDESIRDVENNVEHC